MTKAKVQSFGGMIPAVDDRLLPDDNASNATNLWLYSGDLQGIRVPRSIYTLVNPNARYAFRIPKGASDVAHIVDSYWLEFADVDTLVVKSPLTNSADPAYYFASPSAVPMYTTLSRIVAAQASLILGIPAPAIAPTVSSSGGVSGTNVTRAYVYTWVTAYGEEGPPSPPSTLHTGKIDDTWAIGVTAPGGGVTTGRNITKVNVYRTVTSASGLAQFYFVTQFVIATTTYNDTIADTLVSAAGQLLSAGDGTTGPWTPPPSDLVGIVSMSNGILVGWRGNEIWFSEPYRPWAWPVGYQISTSYDIVGIAAVGQSIVIGTEGNPWYCTGNHPSNMVLNMIPSAEPCISRGSFVATPGAIYYASPNGLISVTPGNAVNATRKFITKADWSALLNLSQMRAVVLNQGYYVFSGVQELAFQADAFQTDAFQQEDESSTRDGAYLDLQDSRVGVTHLHAATATFNVMQDLWTGEVLLLRDGQIQLLDITADQQMGSYIWTSKIFVLPQPENLGAMKVIYELPVGVISPTSTLKLYCDGKLQMTKMLPATRHVFKLPSGYKGSEYQFDIEGTLVIKSVEIASSVDQLKQV